MLFNSIAFLVFLPIVLAGYFVLRTRGQNIWLVIASMVFYAWWDVRFLFLLLVPTLIDFVCALKIHQAVTPQAKKRFLLYSVCTNLIILGFFKYFNFFIDSAGLALETFGIDNSRWALNIILPVGISFYTFHELSYVIDVYRGDLEPVSDFWLYFLYVLYFPQLVAGPIARASKLLPQLSRARYVYWQNIRVGMVLILIGYFKKVGVADALAPLVDQRFNNPAVFSGAELLLSLYMFSIQIYCDFSGYTDIARGVSKLFGIELALNFNHPYFSANITDFWRRWHISLSTWLRDYLYIPLGGNRNGIARTYRNLMLTMLLGGLWHGANWTFVVWGGLHGLYLSADKFLKENVGRMNILNRGDLTRGLIYLFKVICTFHLVALTWIFFRSDSFSIAWAYLNGILNWQPAMALAPASAVGMRVIVLFTSLLVLEVIQQWHNDETIILNQHWFVRGVSYAALVILTFALGGINVGAPFIYFQF